MPYGIFLPEVKTTTAHQVNEPLLVPVLSYFLLETVQNGPFPSLSFLPPAFLWLTSDAQALRCCHSAVNQKWKKEKVLSRYMSRPGSVAKLTTI